MGPSRQLLEELKALGAQIRDEALRRAVVSVLEDPTLTFTDAKPLISVEEAPAAPRKHHFFTGGLLVHTLSVAWLTLAMAEVFERVYGLQVNKDLALAAALLHDIFKYYQYSADHNEGGYRARGDWYLSHDYAIVAELAVRGAPDALIRAVSEAHGLAPFSTLEGFIVHLADSADARFGEHLQTLLLSRAKDVEREGCNPYKALNELIASVGITSVVGVWQSGEEVLRERLREACARSVKQ